jgi:choline dehydrogenase-like flavoprotein
MPVLDGASATRDVQRAADAVVVGTGAGGAVVAATLAEAGAGVLLLEEGAYHRTAEFNARPLDMVARLYRNRGLTATLGVPTIGLPLGCAVGGTTTVNSGTCFPAPDYVLEQWVREEGLEDYAPASLAPRFEEVSRRLGVTPVSEDLLGPNARLFRQGARALGFAGEPIPRNVRGCVGTGVCAFGCPTGAKQSTNLSYVPAALEAGAELVTRARVRRVLLDGRRAIGVEASLLDEQGASTGRRLRVLAGATVIAAGAVHTPVLLGASGVRHPALGRNLRIHPAARVGALFDEPVRGWIGVPQSYHVSQFEREGIFIQGIFAPPAIEAPTIPGIGREHRERMRRFAHLGSFGALISESGTGRVVAAPGRQPLVLYSLARADRGRLARAISLTAQTWFAAGATEVYTSVRCRPVLRSMAEARAFADEEIRAKYFDVMAFHPMGTARMSADPGRGVVDGSGRVHGYAGLYVADASVLPSSTRRNPQLTIMAVAMKIAQDLARALSKPA